MVKERRIAIVTIDPVWILAWMDFKGGSIEDIRLERFSGSGMIEILLEHSDLGLVQEGSRIPRVCPLYSEVLPARPTWRRYEPKRNS